MPRIARSVVEEIHRINIFDIISPHVSLARKGRAVTGLCPFHSEKTPSFHVNEDKGFFKCFGCGEAGDGITFIMKYRYLDYYDAVVYICEHFGVEIKYDAEDTPAKPIKELKELHELFAKRAAACLFSAEGAIALEYLKERGFGEDTIKQFGVGWAPSDISPALFEKSFDRSVLASSGIFFETKFGLKSFFADRILFPIRNAAGSCVGFSGRTINPNESAKYKNSPQTPIFSKREELYNLHNAKEAMKKDSACFIVEGYFDAMRMHAAGYPQTVAIMGTAFTKEQATRLKKYAEEYNLILDGDEAGINAMIKSMDVAIECDIYPNVIFLPAGEDPDTFLKSNGKESFDEFLEERRDLILHVIKEKRGRATDNNKRINRLIETKKILEQIKNPYRREYYLKETAALFGVSEETLNADLNFSKSNSYVIKKAKSFNNVNYPVEKKFISCLFQLPEDMFDEVISDITPDCFEDERFCAIFKKIIELSAQGDSIRQLINDMEVGETVSDLLYNEPSALEYSVALECKDKLLINRRNKKRSHLANQMFFSGADDLNAYVEQLRVINEYQKKTYKKRE